MSSFVFRELKNFDPTIEISVVCTKHQAYLFQSNPYIDHIYFVKKRSISDYIRCSLELRRKKFDVVIDPTIFIRNRDLILLRLINASNYVGYKKSNYKIFNINIEGEYHFSMLYEKALNKIGINVGDTTYEVPSDNNAEKDINLFLQENNISHYLTINFYGAARIKKVNDENIKSYLSYLTKITNGKKIVLLSYPEVTEKLIQLSQGYQNVFVHNTTSIFHTIALIRHCDQLITTDTSTVHIASGLNKKIIAIYKEDPIAFTHWQPKSKAETHILFYKENINEISPEQIEPDWLV